MSPSLTRLRRGELLAAAGALGLLVLLFAVAWFRFTGAHGAVTDADGVTSLPVLRWFLLASALGGLLAAALQATRAAPALPVTVDVVVLTLVAVSTVLLVVRLPTDGGHPLVGAYLGLVAMAALDAGVFLALRQEDGWVPDADHPVAEIALGDGSPRAGRA